MAIGRSPKTITEYVLVEDRDKPQDAQTVFLLGTIPYGLRAEYIQRCGKPGAQDGDVLRASMEVIVAVLKGWRNFKDQDGKEIPFEVETRTVMGYEVKDAATEDTLSALTYHQTMQLVDALMETLNLTATDRKN